MSRRKICILASVILLLLLSAYVFIFDSTGGHHTKQDINQVEMEQIGNALRRLKVDTGSYPDSLESLSKAFPNGIPQDRFTKKGYIYITDGNDFALISLGKDHKSGGLGPDADIVITSNN